jgi:hypothetical protein
VAGDEVGVGVGEEDVVDPAPERAGVRDVLVHVPLRVAPAASSAIGYEACARHPRYTA